MESSGHVRQILLASNVQIHVQEFLFNVYCLLHVLGFLLYESDVHVVCIRNNCNMHEYGFM